LLTEKGQPPGEQKNLLMNQSSIGKHRRSNLKTPDNRWKWMAAGAAATAAGVTVSQATLVTVNLTNNFISGAGGNHLNPDLTGDGNPDITIVNAFNYRHVRTSSGHTLTGFTKSLARVDLNGIHARVYLSADYRRGSVQLGSKTGQFYRSSGTTSLTGSIPISFRDLHINNGALTKGSLEVTASGLTATVQLDTLTYNTRDQGSSLALLAMGAGGILALRRWRLVQNPARS
jgi:hypothetical protein